MKTLVFFCALLALQGCGARPLREEPAMLPPANPGEEDPASQDDPVVAFIDDKPVTWRTVVDHSMNTRGRELIEKYILWKLRRDRLEELGIKNTPDDLRKRAQIAVDAWKKQIGREQFDKYLESRKLTEAAYIDSFATNVEFDEHVKNEKAVAYAMLTENAIEIDTVAFTDQQEAGVFSVLANRTSFGEAVERLQSGSSAKGQVAYWPRHRFPKGLAPDVLAATPELEQKLFTMKKGHISGVESAKSMFLVFHVVDVHAAQSATYASVADKVMAEVLRQPPSKEQTALWMERLFKSKRIRYEDRYTPRNQGR